MISLVGGELNRQINLDIHGFVANLRFRRRAKQKFPVRGKASPFENSEHPISVYALIDDTRARRGRVRLVVWKGVVLVVVSGVRLPCHLDKWSENESTSQHRNAPPRSHRSLEFYLSSFSLSFFLLVHLCVSHVTTGKQRGRATFSPTN